MKKIFFATFLLIFQNLSAQMLEKIDSSVLRAKIAESSAKEVAFKAQGLAKGMSGVIATKNGDNEILIADVVVQSVQGDEVRASFTDFKALEQKYLPTPLQKPKAGDEVIFKSFYNRALVIAPNLESYSHIVSKNQNLEFTHSDLLAAFMQQESLNAPNPKALKKFCSNFSIGLVFVLNSENVAILDCQSFQKIGVQNLPDSEILHASKPNVPFYWRVIDPKKKGKLGSRVKKKVGDYFKYYDELVAKN